MKNRRLLKLTSVFLLLALAMVLVVACGGPAPTPTSSPTPTASPKPTATSTPVATSSPTPTASPKPTATSSATVSLRWSQFFSASDFRTQLNQHYADIISQKSGGRLQMKVFPSESLAKAGEELDMLRLGIIDIASLGAPYVASKLPFLNATQLPFYTTLDKFDAFATKTASLFAKNYATLNIKYLYGTSDGYMQLEHRAKFLKVAADWKGQKMRMGGGYQSRIGQTLGASVVSVASPEQYMALQTGTVDGTMTSIGSYMSYKLNEVALYVSIWDLLSTKRDVAINLDKWNSIPPDLQKLILDTLPGEQLYAANSMQDFEKKAIDEITKLGAKVYILTPEERAQFVKLLAPLYDEFAGLGPDNKAYVDTVREFQK